MATVYEVWHQQGVFFGNIYILHHFRDEIVQVSIIQGMDVLCLQVVSTQRLHEAEGRVGSLSQYQLMVHCRLMPQPQFLLLYRTAMYDRLAVPIAYMQQ